MSRETFIERATKDKLHPYGVLLRATFDGSPLSFEARGLLAYILMKHDGWRVTIPDLMREGGIGRDKCYTLLTELITHDYAERLEDRDPVTKRFTGHKIKVYESPMQREAEVVAEPLPDFPIVDSEPLTDFPDTAFPDPALPLPANTHHSNYLVVPNTDLVPTTEKEGKNEPREISQTPTAPDSFIPSAPPELDSVDYADCIELLTCNDVGLDAAMARKLTVELGADFSLMERHVFAWLADREKPGAKYGGLGGLIKRITTKFSAPPLTGAQKRTPLFEHFHGGGYSLYETGRHRNDYTEIHQ